MEQIAFDSLTVNLFAVFCPFASFPVNLSAIWCYLKLSPSYPILAPYPPLHLLTKLPTYLPSSLSLSNENKLFRLLHISLIRPKPEPPIPVTYVAPCTCRSSSALLISHRFAGLALVRSDNGQVSQGWRSANDYRKGDNLLWNLLI